MMAKLITRRKDDSEYVYECLNCFTQYHNIEREVAETEAEECCVEKEKS